jgi:predicted nucleic acid-binding Zn ribbon protein
MKRRRLKNPVSAGSVLGKVLTQLGLSPSISKHNIVQLWPRIVDSAVSRHAKAEKVVGSTLHVIVDSSVWMNELAAVKNVLIDKVNARIRSEAAKITDIRFQQRSWAKERPQPAHAGTPPPRELTEKEVRLVRTLLEPVKDDRLKALLKRILEKDALLKQAPKP